MSTCLLNAGSDVHELAMDTVENYHRELLDAEVTLYLEFHDDLDATADLDDRSRPIPLLKHQGYAAAAVVKITPYAQRTKGVADAVITLDKGLWSVLKPAEQVALLDHELTHVEVQVDDEGDVKRDNAGRPKLKLRLHDVSLGVFDSVIKRHGAASIDARVVHACHERYRQAAFSWADDMAPQDEPPPSSLDRRDDDEESAA